MFDRVVVIPRYELLETVGFVVLAIFFKSSYSGFIFIIFPFCRPNLMETVPCCVERILNARFKVFLLTEVLLTPKELVSCKISCSKYILSCNLHINVNCVLGRLFS